MADPDALPVTARRITPADEERWTAYVDAHERATMYHTLPWRDLLASVFRHRPTYVIAERDGAVTGVLPLFLAGLPLLGHKLLSLPHDIGSGGALADDDATETALVRAAGEIARARGVKYAEFRCGEPRPALEALELVRSEPVLVSVMDLDGREAVWKRVQKDHRKAVRKAERRGVTVRVAETEADYEALYDVYTRVFLAFGTPPYPRSYFHAVRERLGGAGARTLLAELDGAAVGGIVSFVHGRTLVSKFAVCLADAIDARVYPALYARCIDEALDAGCTFLSWGTSSRAQKGLIEFKERWGARTTPACVYSISVRGAPPDLEAYYDDEGPAQRAWKKLPLALTRVLGGPLNRWYC